MNLDLNMQLVESYRSASQKIRVLTEDWVNNEAYCPNCGNERLDKYLNNKPVADFFCSRCNEDFELKSKKGQLGAKIVDGAYQSMLDRFADIHNPNLFLLNYNLFSCKVLNLFVIPRHFFVSEIIEKRNPLSSGARRAGWIGCNILISRVPESGRIFLIKDRQVMEKEKVCAAWHKTLFLREEKKAESKGWILDVMRCIELIRKKEFTLAEVYNFESTLGKQHQNNKHIKDKIRQQLQILRDNGYLEFIDRGKYRLI